MLFNSKHYQTKKVNINREKTGDDIHTCFNNIEKYFQEENFIALAKELIKLQEFEVLKGLDANQRAEKMIQLIKTNFSQENVEKLYSKVVAFEFAINDLIGEAELQSYQNELAKIKIGLDSFSRPLIN